MINFNIERILQPDLEAYRNWQISDVTVHKHFPRGTMAPKSLGEGYEIRVSQPVFTDHLATTLAGYLEDEYPESDYGVGVAHHDGIKIPNMHIFRCPKGTNPLHSGITDAYVLEGPALNNIDFRQQAMRGGIQLLLHEGAHPHRGDLPKFVHWLESVKAVPKIG